MALKNLPLIPWENDEHFTRWDFESHGANVVNLKLNALTYIGENGPTVVTDDEYDFSQLIAGLSKISKNEITGYLTDGGVAYELNGEEHLIENFIIDFNSNTEGQILVFDSEPAIIHLDDAAMRELIQSSAGFIIDADKKYDAVPFLDADREISEEIINEINERAMFTQIYIENDENIKYSIPENIYDYHIIGIIKHPDLDLIINPNDEDNVTLLLEDEKGTQITCIISEAAAMEFEAEEMRKTLQENKAVISVSDSNAEPNTEYNLPHVPYSSFMYIKDIQIAENDKRVIGNVCILGEDTQKCLGVPVEVDVEKSIVSFSNDGLITKYYANLTPEQFSQLEERVIAVKEGSAHFVKTGIVENDSLTYKYAVQTDEGHFYNVDDITHMSKNGYFIAVNDGEASKLLMLKQPIAEMNIDAINLSDIELFDPAKNIIITRENGSCYDINGAASEQLEQEIIKAGFNKVDGIYINTETQIDKTQALILTENPKEITMANKTLVSDALITQEGDRVVLSGSGLEKPVDIRKISIENINGSKVLIAESRDRVQYNISSFNENQHLTDLDCSSISQLTRKVNVIADSVRMTDVYMFENENNLYAKVNGHYLCISDSSVPSKTEDASPIRSIRVDERIYDEMVERAAGKYLRVTVQEDKITVEAVDERCPELGRMEKLTTFTAQDISELEEQEKEAEHHVEKISETTPEIGND